MHSSDVWKNSRAADDRQLIRIMVIEDNEEDRLLLSRELTKAKLDGQVFFTSDGHNGLKLLVDGHDSLNLDICAVFLDLNLPGMSGTEVLRAIRGLPRTSSLPVIVLTGSDDPSDLEECRKLKATSYLTKPISFASFSQALANVFHLPIPAATEKLGPL
jgi:CheY-like chemotaxis protein